MANEKAKKMAANAIHAKMGKRELKHKVDAAFGAGYSNIGRSIGKHYNKKNPKVEDRPLEQ